MPTFLPVNRWIRFRRNKYASKRSRNGIAGTMNIPNTNANLTKNPERAKCRIVHLAKSMRKSKHPEMKTNLNIADAFCFKGSLQKNSRLNVILKKVIKNKHKKINSKTKNICIVPENDLGSVWARV
jgi:hypothetical protein